MLYIAPCTFAQAQEFIRLHHRHHEPPQGHKFSLCVHNGKAICGVATIGRPIARKLDDGVSLEITRVCTDGTRNAPSKLLCAAWRAAQAMGYQRILTYTLPEEGGASLRGAGFVACHQTRDGTWSNAKRPRKSSVRGEKIRWEKNLQQQPPPIPAFPTPQTTASLFPELL